VGLAEVVHFVVYLLHETDKLFGTLQKGGKITVFIGITASLQQ